MTRRLLLLPLLARVGQLTLHAPAARGIEGGAILGPYRAHTMLGSEFAEAESECPRTMRGSARERLNLKLAALLKIEGPLGAEWRLLHERRGGGRGPERPARGLVSLRMPTGLLRLGSSSTALVGVASTPRRYAFNYEAYVARQAETNEIVSLIDRCPMLVRPIIRPAASLASFLAFQLHNPTWLLAPPRYNWTLHSSLLSPRCVRLSSGACSDTRAGAASPPPPGTSSSSSPPPAGSATRSCG